MEVSDQPPTKIFVSIGYLGSNVSSKEREAQGSKLGMFYQSVTNCLLRRGNFSQSKKEKKVTAATGEAKATWWRRLKKMKGSRFPDLILGGACGHGIPYRRLSSSSSTYPKTLVNYYRGFEVICRKTKMVETLRSMFTAQELSTFLPESFLFYPARTELNETDLFVEVFDADINQSGRSLWICKPSDGSKGRDIFVTEDKEEILSMFASPLAGEDLITLKKTAANTAKTKDDNLSNFADWKISQSKSSTGNIAWVVQKYVQNPMLLNGQRKFDMRLWVLVDHQYDIYIHQEFVLRTTSVPYTTDKEALRNDFIHLSNHCIQLQSEQYGQYETTNEMFRDEFSAWLSKHYLVQRNNTTTSTGKPPFAAQQQQTNSDSSQEQKCEEWCSASFDEDIMPQLKRIVAMTLHAARSQIENLPGASYASFNLFGFDFMIDDVMKVHLLEINSSPAVADRLLETITQDVVDLAIHSYYDDDKNNNTKIENGFCQVDCQKWM